MNPAAVTLAIVVAVAVVAWLMRGSGGSDDVGGAEESRGAGASGEREREASGAEVLDEDLETGALVEAAAITSDGWSFVPIGEGVELIPPGEDEEALRESGSEQLAQAAAAAPVNPHTGRRLVHWKPGEPLAAGDFIAARVVRGAPSVDPWRLEALGRDYDYQSFAFETEEAARVALELVGGRIVRPPRDEHGDPIPVGAEDFVVARRKAEETEQALAMSGDEDELDDPSQRG